MVELSANISWLDPLDWHDLATFEPVYDADNDIDSVERIAQVEAMAVVLFKPFFETGLMGFDACPRGIDEVASNYLFRIHCARSVEGYADYNRNPQVHASVKLQPSTEEEWERLLVDTATPIARRHTQSITPSLTHKSGSAFKPKPPRHPPTPVSHIKSVQKAAQSPFHEDIHAHERYTASHRQGIPGNSIQIGQQGRITTPDSDSDSGEEDTDDEPSAPPRALFRQFSSSTLVNSDTQLSSGAPSRDAAIADLIRGIAEDSQEMVL